MGSEQKEKQLLDWLASKADTLDEVLLTTAQRYCEDMGIDPNQLAPACRELFKAGDGENIDYAIEHIGVAYSLWYHPRRFNMMCGLLAKRLVDNRTDTINVLDLGTGTGAVLWAFAILSKGIEELGLRSKTLSIKFISSDNSVSMLTYAERLFLALKEANLVGLRIEVTFENTNWEEALKSAKRFTWVIANYLFDYQESDAINETAERFVKSFLCTKPYKLFLLTSGTKRQIINAIRLQIEESKAYSRNFYSNNLNNNIRTYPIPFKGHLEKATNFRKALPIKTNKVEWYVEEDQFASVEVFWKAKQVSAIK